MNVRIYEILGLTNLLSEHSSDLVELGNGSHFPYCGTQLYVIGRIIVASKFVGYLNINKINIPVFMVLFWGIRPEWEITPLPFLLPLGVELFLDASTATSAVLTALSLGSSLLESFFSAA